MDQEAKYWRDKWLDTNRHIEALRATILDHNQSEGGKPQPKDGGQSKTATTNEKAAKAITSVNSGERRKKCQKSTKS